MSNRDLILLGALALALWYVARKAGAVVAAVNPADPNNVFNQGANGIAHALGVPAQDSIGTWLYGVLHPDNQQQADVAPAWGISGDGW